MSDLYGNVDLSKAQWRRSSKASDGPAVEVAFIDGVIAVRMNPTSPVLLFTPGEWDAFREGAKDGEFDL